MWRDIAAIVFICTTVNHLGLIAAMERTVKYMLPIINCPKCLTFWCVLAYNICSFGFSDISSTLAISLLSAYLAIWLELLEGIIDKLYNYVYDKIYSTTNTTDDGTEHT